jgi:hypothetical protein
MKRFRNLIARFLALALIAFIGVCLAQEAKAQTPIFVPDGPDVAAAATVALVTPATAALSGGNVWLVAIAYEINSTTGSVAIADVPSAATPFAGIPAKLEFKVVSGNVGQTHYEQFLFPIRFTNGVVARLVDSKVRVFVIPEHRRRALPMSY